MATFVGVVLVLAPAARAQDRKATDAEKAAAEHLFQEGRTLFDQKRIEEACAKFAESARLEAAPGTLLNLAECYEAAGRNASAWARYRELQNVATRLGQQRRAEHAAARVRALEPTLAHLVLAVEKPSPSMTVRQDEVELGQAAWGTRLPIDPGTHVITASAPGRQTWSSKVVVTRGDVRVIVPPLDVAAPIASAGPKTAPPASSGAGLRTAGVITLVVGGVAALGSVGFGVGAKLENDAARADECGPSSCTSEGAARIDRAVTYGNVSTGFAIGAGVALATGVVLLVLAPGRRVTSAAGARGTAWSTAPLSFQF